MTRMICPVMSRSALVMSEQSTELEFEHFAQECIGSRCAFWRWNRNVRGGTPKTLGRCGYADGKGGESFADPAQNGGGP